MTNGPDPDLLSALSLAYVGDCVYELYIRELSLAGGDRPVSDLHSASASLARAPFQAAAVKVIEPTLGADELAVLRRGMNAKNSHVPKNATPKEYRLATGFEALIGWLYLKGRFDRLEEIVLRVTDAPSRDQT
ncbi:MAG: Mini-ribonuclease 3 [Clostridia bacterium]|nr:Mini-ribonuclease 3 [Clostridia bacterium]